MFGVGFEGITKTKESALVPVKSEMHACVLLWFHGYCSQGVGSCCTDGQSILLHRNSSKTEEECHVGSFKHDEELVASWRECASPCSAICSAVFDISIHYDDVAVSLLTWSCTLRLLFFFSKSKISSENAPLGVNGIHPEGCNKGRKLHPTCFVPGMLQTMAPPLWKVCAGKRNALWKWPHCSWWINKIIFWTSLITLLSGLVK